MRAFALFRGPPRRRSFKLAWLTTELAIAREPADEDWPFIAEAGISCVVDLRAEAEAALSVLEANGIEYLRFPVAEGAPPTDEQLEEMTDAILSRIAERRPVLVHCREGRGRSALVVVAVLVRLGLPIFTAYQVLHRVRPQVALTNSQTDALERFVTQRPVSSSEDLPPSG